MISPAVEKMRRSNQAHFVCCRRVVGIVAHVQLFALLVGGFKGLDLIKACVLKFEAPPGSPAQAAQVPSNTGTTATHSTYMVVYSKTAVCTRP